MQKVSIAKIPVAKIRRIPKEIAPLFAPKFHPKECNKSHFDTPINEAPFNRDLTTYIDCSSFFPASVNFALSQTLVRIYFCFGNPKLNFSFLKKWYDISFTIELLL